MVRKLKKIIIQTKNFMTELQKVIEEHQNNIKVQKQLFLVKT